MHDDLSELLHAHRDELRYEMPARLRRKLTHQPRLDRPRAALAGAWEQAHPWPRSAGGYEPFDAGLA